MILSYSCRFTSDELSFNTKPARYCVIWVHSNFLLRSTRIVTKIVMYMDHLIDKYGFRPAKFSMSLIMIQEILVTI